MVVIKITGYFLLNYTKRAEQTSTKRASKVYSSAQ